MKQMMSSQHSKLYLNDKEINIGPSGVGMMWIYFDSTVKTMRSKVLVIYPI